MEWDTVCTRPSAPLTITNHVPQVLRYSQYTRAITDIIRSGRLGQLINAQHIEPVGHWHFAHSYVRGNWSKEAESSFSLMTKSCQCVLLFDGPHATRTNSFILPIFQRHRHSLPLAFAGHTCPCVVIWWVAAFPQAKQTRRGWGCNAMLGLQL